MGILLSREFGQIRLQTMEIWLSSDFAIQGVAVFWTITTLTIKHYTESSGDFVSSHYLRSAVSQAVLATLIVVCASQIVSDKAILVPDRH